MLASDEQWQSGEMYPLEWCRQMQEVALDNNNVKAALVYNELARMWMERRDAGNKI